MRYQSVNEQNSFGSWNYLRWNDERKFRRKSIWYGATCTNPGNICYPFGVFIFSIYTISLKQTNLTKTICRKNTSEWIFWEYIAQQFELQKLFFLWGKRKHQLFRTHWKSLKTNENSVICRSQKQIGIRKLFCIISVEYLWNPSVGWLN